MARTGRPPGSGKWQQAILDRLEDSADLGVPVTPLIPFGTGHATMQKLIAAGRRLSDTGLVIRFRMWYPNAEVPDKYMRTYVALPGYKFDDGLEVERFVDVMEVKPINTGGRTVYPGSIPSYQVAYGLEQADDAISEHKIKQYLARMSEPAQAELEQAAKDYKRAGVPKPMKKKVMRRDRYRCVECKADVLDADLEVDHIVPVAEGGKTNTENLQTLCSGCHRTKTGRENSKRLKTHAAVQRAERQGP